MKIHGDPIQASGKPNLSDLYLPRQVILYFIIFIIIVSIGAVVVLLFVVVCFRCFCFNSQSCGLRLPPVFLLDHAMNPFSLKASRAG